MASKFSEDPRDEPFEWDAPVSSISPPSAGHALASRDARDAREAQRPAVPPLGIRDHYIADRFPGLAHCGGDLEDVARIIAGARLYFDEGKTDRALELLDLAVEQCPCDEPLRLARLEIAFLLRDGDLFTALATEFRQVRGAGLAWREIARLGRAVAPLSTLFGSKQNDRSHEHYGPWPHTPNWINASWDLTPDVLAVDYHRLMARTAPHAGKRQAGVVTTKKR
jgi:hypothetical protein